MGFVIISGEKSKALAALGRWSVGHARQARRRVSGVQGAERSASSTEPCRQWGSPFASPNPGDGPRQVTGGGGVGDYIVVDRFYVALFSALEQTHCART